MAPRKPAAKKKTSKRAKKAPAFTPETKHRVVNPAHIDAERVRGLAPAKRRR